MPLGYPNWFISSSEKIPAIPQSRVVQSITVHSIFIGGKKEIKYYSLIVSIGWGRATAEKRIANQEQVRSGA